MWWKHEGIIMWIIFILLMFLGWLGGLARADVVTNTQDVVVSINQIIYLTVDELDDLRMCLDPYVPLDDFEIVVNSKHIGFKFTF